MPKTKIHKKPPETPLELLDRSYRVLMHRGSWVQNTYRVARTNYGNLRPDSYARCFIQTLNDCDGKVLDDTVKNFIQPAIRELHPGRPTDIIRFNDTAGTTKQDVLNVLELAKSKAEAAEKGEEQ